MNRLAQAIGRARLQDFVRAIEIIGVHLQSKRDARWSQEQKAADELVVVEPRLQSLVGQ